MITWIVEYSELHDWWEVWQLIDGKKNMCYIYMTEQLAKQAQARLALG